MKRALVLALVLIVGLGAAGFCASPLTGSWKTSFAINPAATAVTLLFPSFSSTLSLDYILSGWDFNSASVFSLLGYSSQSFKVTGTLGAFTLSSTMAFAPSKASSYTYPLLGNWTYDTTWPLMLATPINVCSIWVKTPLTFAPAFLTWTASGSVNIAGVGVEGLLFMDQSHQPCTVTLNQYFTLTQGQTASYTCDPYCNGVGFRLALTGSFGGVAAASYTYFSLTETSAADEADTTICPTVDRSGVFHNICCYALDCALGCGAPITFTDEYITLKGFSFGCVTLDIGLDISCAGFGSVNFVVKDINIANWIGLTVGVEFTTTDKSVTLCATFLQPKMDCFIIDIGFGDNLPYSVTDDALSISNITIHGFGFSYKFNGVTFKALTALDEFSTLIGDGTAWKYVNGASKLAFMIPVVAQLNCDLACKSCDPADYYFGGVATQLFQLSCIATDRLRIWEQWIITFGSDSCCGGALSAKITTSFGDLEKLVWYGYAIAPIGSAVYVPVMAYGSAASVPTFANRTTCTTIDKVLVKSVYASSGVSSLFNWAASDISVSIGLGTNFSLQLGLGLTYWGWGSLNVGFTFTF